MFELHRAEWWMHASTLESRELQHTTHANTADKAKHNQIQNRAATNKQLTYNVSVLCCVVLCCLTLQCILNAAHVLLNWWRCALQFNVSSVLRVLFRAVLNSVGHRHIQSTERGNVSLSSSKIWVSGINITTGLESVVSRYVTYTCVMRKVEAQTVWMNGLFYDFMFFHIHRIKIFSVRKKEDI